MTILNSKEIEQYRNLRISDLELASNSGIGEITLERLRLKEEELTKNRYGLPFYLAFQYHIKGITMKELQYELGVKYTPLVSIFDYYGIPRLSRSEAQQRSFKERGPRKKRAEDEREKQEKIDHDKFFADERKAKIIGTYSKIAGSRVIVDGNWRGVIPEVSEKTKYPEEVVTSCLEDLFGVKVEWRIKKFKYGLTTLFLWQYWVLKELNHLEV